MCGGGLSTSRATYCSNACRQGAYRRRAATTRERQPSSLCQIVTEGVSTCDDAAPLRNEVDALRIWLAGVVRDLSDTAELSSDARHISSVQALGDPDRARDHVGFSEGRLNANHHPRNPPLPPDLFGGFAVGEVVDVGQFYSDLLYELGEHAARGGTAYGAAAVAKRVALAHGVEKADVVPLPRPTRAERAERRDRAWVRSQAVR